MVAQTIVMLVWLLGLTSLAAGQTVKADFNHDGFADLAIGAPGESVGNIVGAGAVHIIYGRASGLTGPGNQLFHQNSEGLLETARAGDGFGAALATGDFNNDGFVDLAIGVPDEDMEGIEDAGVVHIVYGSASGLAVTENQLFHRNRPGLQGLAAADDRFGGHSPEATAGRARHPSGPVGAAPRSAAAGALPSAVSQGL